MVEDSVREDTERGECPQWKMYINKPEGSRRDGRSETACIKVLVLFI